MKYIKQLSIILFLSLIGEIIHFFVPLPVPASIYGLVLMLAGLITGFIPLEAVREASMFLIDIMPLMFIPAAVGLLDSWEILRPILLPFAVITIVSTIAVMAAAGKVTQFFIKTNKKERRQKDE